ncbi:leucyl aminopeptidase [Stackebrandtia albiflava]|uniref:Probable cytosol aminopeptidase n=1 Tax=Stackebrandtia albiflava TaxID=406432 RepID=A0A562VBF7_9ACTN|nr:leucyl aminopeptidase [Stackebrandtia albiflava]TWJ15157.1 leucyl aminopeptidase [Stackebrandtia albiflava]
MPTLALSTDDAASVAADVLLIGLHKGEDGPVLAPGAEAVESAFGELLPTLEALGATGEEGGLTTVPSMGRVAATLITAVGLGERSDDGPSAETLRRAAGAAARSAAGKDSIVFAVSGDAEALATGALLGAYQFADYRTDRTGLKDPVAAVTLLGADCDVSRVTALTDGVRAARDWANTPGNLLPPKVFAEQVAEAAQAAGLGVEVLDEEALAAGGYGGILAVGNGSSRPPRLVRLTYRAEGASGHVALVGKGITFDTGGISIKPAQGMWDMKGDMAGAAAVAGAMLAVAALKPSVDVTAYLPMAENMPSGTAYRPGDVVTAYGGKTIEVINTDAEGRMVLCDALTRAAEDEPDAIYDIATLTGGQVMALGKRIAGVMGSEEECARVKRVGESTGEAAWPMPFPEEVRKTMKSRIADVLQGSANMERSGHMLQGGIFLDHFVDDDMPWAHIDIAGPADHGGEPYGYIVKGATGFGVRTLVALVEDRAA